MTDAEIDQRAWSIKWEISGMAWKAAEEIGCLDQYIAQASMSIMRREIIRIFKRASVFARL